jgi:corrinoid protein of di/trimethylamine methyltransferase
MTENEIYEGLKDAVIRGDQTTAVSLAEQSVSLGMDPVRTFEDGLKAGIAVVGDGYAKMEYFLPDLVMAAEAMKAAAVVLEEEIRKTGGERQSLGKVVIGTVSGDLHDIGKTIVGTLFTSYGFEVIDLGVDVKLDEFVQAVIDEQPEFLGMSSLLTVTAKEHANVILALGEAGLRDRVKVIVGGGAITSEYAEEIGADGYGQNAELGVRTAMELLGADAE